MYTIFDEPKLAVCIGCGCDDECACNGGCGWLRVDRSAGTGVCTRCPDQLAAWDSAERAPDNAGAPMNDAQVGSRLHTNAAVPGLSTGAAATRVPRCSSVPRST